MTKPRKPVPKSQDLPTPGQPRDAAQLADHSLARSGDSKKLGRSGDRNKIAGGFRLTRDP